MGAETANLFGWPEPRKEAGCPLGRNEVLRFLLSKQTWTSRPGKVHACTIKQAGNSLPPDAPP